MNVVVLGPYGAGKSTLVRRIMRTRPCTKVYGSGILPMAYRAEDLVVYGNYERTSRSRHGMTIFERDPHAFDEIMRIAATEPLPGLMEGGFTKTERLWYGYGPTFARTCRVIYLDAQGAPMGRLGKRLTDKSLTDYEYKILRTTRTFQELGVGVEFVRDRQVATDKVCELLGLRTPEGVIEVDYR